MRIALTPETIHTFVTRYGSLHDAVIYQVTLSLFPNAHLTTPTCVLTMGAPIIEETPRNPPAWGDFTLIMEEVTHYIIKQAPNYTSGVLRNVIIGFFHEHVYMDFVPDNETYTNADEFDEKLSASKSVICMIVGKRCFWEEHIPT